MTIEFRHNERPTVGVEMELHVVDADLGSTRLGGERDPRRDGRPLPGR